MAPRLGYRKSRGGCQLCKRRKVKCDEKRPCSSCIRHGAECSYKPSPSARARSHQDRNGEHPQGDTLSAPSATRVDGNAVAIRSPSQQPWAPLTPQNHQRKFSHVALTAQGVFAEKDILPRVPPAAAGPSPVKPAAAATAANPDSETWSMDLFLMHHYSSSTFASLPRSIEVYDIWQQEIPKLAAGHLFLMHQLLATAAYHLVHLRPDQRRLYLLHALRHQNEAIVRLQAALPCLAADNCHAFFAGSSLLTMAGFAASSPDPSSNMNSMSISSLLDTFVLIRGMSEILECYEDHLREGSLGQLFRLGEQQTCPVLESTVEQLQKLELPPEIPAEEAEICRNAVTATTRWMTGRRSAMRVALSWPICLSDGFLGLLRTRHPIAMVILSYYAVLLHVAGSEMWFLRSWGGKILEDISNSIGRGYRPLIEWSMASAGLSV